MNLQMIGLAIVVAAGGGLLAKSYFAGATHERNKIVAASQAQGNAANAKNEIVRKRAELPGAADRIRKDPRTCPDCFAGGTRPAAAAK